MISSIVSYSRPRVVGELSMCTASLVVLGAVCPDYSCGASSQLDGMNVGKLHYSAYVAYCGFVWLRLLLGRLLPALSHSLRLSSGERANSAA